VLRVVPGTDAHTKGATGCTRLNDVVGRWISIPPPHFDEGELRSREGCLGTGNVRVGAAMVLEQGHDDVNETVFSKRNHNG
jgi:hypothetical protein